MLILQLRILNLLYPKWVPHFLGINTDRFITGKSRELNRLCKSAQVTDKKKYKIRSTDQAFGF